MLRLPYSSRAATAGLFVLVLALSGAVAHFGKPAERDEGLLAARRIPAAVKVVSVERVPRAAPAPDELPKIDYWRSPQGFPPDPSPESVAGVREGLHPRHRLAVYDSPGGRPRAFLNRTISGLPVVVPIVERRLGWVAVLLPSVNRRVGWLPATGTSVGWEPRPLRDQLTVDLGDHRLTWLRDGRQHGSWKVAVGASNTPTPLGRTFVLGRTITHGDVYAGLDALVLGAVPDDRDALSAALRHGHTGIHAWSRESAFGRSISNGCVRMPPEAQRALLHHIPAGTVVNVVE